MAKQVPRCSKLHPLLENGEDVAQDLASQSASAKDAMQRALTYVYDHLVYVRNEPDEAPLRPPREPPSPVPATLGGFPLSRLELLPLAP